tara:strand:- start:3106 stop:3984 length:879 start_codon:yes stop_codon:yes gene_type:complete
MSFKFKGFTIEGTVFPSGTDNFNGRYTPLTRTLPAKSNDRLDGGGTGSGNVGFSGYQLNYVDICSTTKGQTHTVNSSRHIYKPTWANGISIQGHGGGGGGGGGGGNAVAYWGYDARAYGADGGDGGEGGYGYLSYNGISPQIYVEIGAGGAGGHAGSNDSSPNNWAQGNGGGGGGAGGTTYVNIGTLNYALTLGRGGNGGGAGTGSVRVNDDDDGTWGAPTAGAGGNANGAPLSNAWNNADLEGLHNRASHGGNGNEWNQNANGAPRPGSGGNTGKAIYRWITSDVATVYIA